VVEEGLDLDLASQLQHHLIVQTAPEYPLDGTNKTTFTVLSHEHLPEFALPQLLSQNKV
jgi:hypothetical protein